MRSVEPKDFISAFLGNCAQNPGRLDKVGAIASTLGYAELPKEYELLLAPQDPQAPFQGWIATDGPGAPFLIGISEGKLRGVTYQFCAVSNPFLDAERAMDILEQHIQLSQPYVDESTAGQRYRAWLVDEVLSGAFLSTTDIGGMGYRGLTLSIAAPKQY
ncbi:hypothetical protein GCM10016455_18530 [Aliiroseovarius zhejiangensis]|uniref:Phage tail protein n=1 Tax=Aliiroseovarius zhejiangensis TaxID=1632025 RepID=A0ABQ3J020_9RHOB|nr:hypothetical protein [Aliiroseovarius zhejiangensis]GHE98154.1 hypothetical protein GCM10016455_18530 [Aliiroseovarius zhejiangensis]